MSPPVSSSHGQVADVPVAGQVVSVLLSLMAVSVLTLFLTQRILFIKVWSRLPLVVWLVFAIYSDSYVFVFATAVLQHSVGVNSNIQICEGAIILCLVCYVTTKFIYLFLVEKAYIIRGTNKTRLQSKLYLFNSFGMLGVYAVVVILNFIFRITRMENGQCIIGMKSIAMIPLISFDAVVNIYLTIIFLVPLQNTYTFKNMPRTRANVRLRTVAFRTFVGSLCTLLSSIVNLSVLMALNGEPGWVCLMCCNSDILFSAVVIQWVTSKDNAGTSSTTSSNDRGARLEPGHGPGRTSKTTPDQHRRSPATPTEVALVDTESVSCPRRIEDDYYDDDGESFGDDSGPASIKLANPTAVVVTTTIRRESKPGGSAFERRLSDSEIAASSDESTRSAFGGVTGPASYSRPHTKITGGKTG